MDWTMNLIFVLLVAINAGGLVWNAAKMKAQQEAMMSRIGEWCKKLERIGVYQDNCSRSLPEKYVSRKEGESIWGHIEEHEKRINSHSERLAVIEAKP